MSADLERGRAAYAARRWGEAYELLSSADRAEPLAPDDLERRFTAAYMLGRSDDLRCLERACEGYSDRGDAQAAGRCAVWVGLHLFMRGEVGPAAGWLGRGERLLERAGLDDCAERGYLLFPDVFRKEAAGDFEGAAACAAEAAELGTRFEDPDLFALAVHSQGQLLIHAGRAAEGLPLLDEAMATVMAGELSPIVRGLVYCGMIVGCQDAFELRRAREWTDVLSRWCDEQPDLVSFTGVCLVHRAEILQLHGAWPDALEEAELAGERSLRARNQKAAAMACYRQGEVHRLRGELEAAEAAYREASRGGCEPQPGLALLRLAQGRSEAAAAAIRRALFEAAERPKRARLLPAAVEILLAAGELESARAACGELQELAASYDSALLAATGAQARGSLRLAEGEPKEALVELRQAWKTWCELETPYEAARARELLGLACRALGDDDSASLELEAAREAFQALGAGLDAARLEPLLAGAGRGETHGLSRRELEVLRLVAAGKSNREIASTLVISEHTVARHVQNIFAKLRVGSRTAASAFAYEHRLV